MVATPQRQKIRQSNDGRPPSRLEATRKQVTRPAAAA
jgi:hypothetical protein